jgi:hypothetical protein
MTKRQRPKDGHPLPPAAPDLLDDLSLLREIPPDLVASKCGSAGWRKLISAGETRTVSS